MKNNFLNIYILFFLIFNLNLFADELDINSSKIKIDSVNKVSIFEGNVKVYDKKDNKLFSDYAKYDKVDEVIETSGKTQIITSGGYKVNGTNIIFNNKKNIIYSNNEADIVDSDGNTIFVEMFNYSTFNKYFFFKRKY